ncbi:MAG: serine/threonine-protein kinase [Sorangiineae bacterium]|nr:serine/threonine-protein kinase [Polyangiaceae bacterium]MEB2321090.1 serine/threonine-protein kinase [Sorangiineae bacterium]
MQSVSAMVSSDENASATLPRVCPACGRRYPADFKVCPHDATPLDDAAGDGDDPLIGATIGESYQVVRVIGEGGMGRVYEARHLRLHNKRFAIKLLHDEYARQPEVVARFQREAESASAIGHPNIVGVYDVHRLPDGRPYIVGEFLDGEELGALLDRVGRLDAPAAVRIVRQVCQALEAAHEHGVIHRDMKPENVFLTGDLSHPFAKILDFGISKQTAAGSTLTQTGMVMGTPSYMAPEQARGAKVDRRADVYAAGAILYRALTGHKPFDAEEATTILGQVLTDEPTRPRQLEPSIPEALELVIERAMAKNPAERYESMTALDLALAPFDTQASPASAPKTVVVASSPVVSGGSTDKTLPAVSASAVAESIAQVTQEARAARPLLVVLSAGAWLWVMGCVVTSLADAVRALHGGGEPLSVSEATLVTVGVAVATLTPATVWIRYLARRVWTSSVRSVEVARRLRRALAASVVTYGAAALGVRLVEALVQFKPLGASLGAWNIALAVAALAVGVGAWLSERRPR